MTPTVGPVSTRGMFPRPWSSCRFLDYFSAIFTGYINIFSSGTYQFTLTSDDGSSLTIDNTTVVNNDGCATSGAITKSGSVSLTAGMQSVTGSTCRQALCPGSLHAARWNCSPVEGRVLGYCPQHPHHNSRYRPNGLWRSRSLLPHLPRHSWIRQQQNQEHLPHSRLWLCRSVHCKPSLAYWSDS